MQGAAPAANDGASPDAVEQGEATDADALSSAVSISTTVDETATPAPSAQQAREAALQDRAAAVQTVETAADADDAAGSEAVADDVSITTDGSRQSAGDKLLGTLASALPASTNGPSTQSAVAAVHLATTLTRDGATEASATAHTIREPVGSPRWADAIGSRLVLMSVRGQQEGSLTLTPEHLGPVEVQISVNKDTANVWFGAQHAETRAALADAMPRLRELLAASGLSLGQSGVSEQAPRRAAGEITGSRSGGAMAEVAATTEAAPAAWRPLRPGLIDTYA
jgi:flagellar hook-length control protein FliK